MQKSATEPDRDKTAGASAGAARPSAAKPRRFALIVAIALLGPIAAAMIGGYLYFASGRFVSTDNAYVKADKIVVSADISGRVVDVLVGADQMVKRGTLLFRIDPEPFRIAVSRAEAQLAAAIQEVGAIRALYDQKVARLTLAEGDLAYQQQHHERQDALTRTGVVSRSGMDTAERALRAARDQILIATQEIAEVRARLGGDPTRPADEQPSVRDARAVRDRAALDLARTEVRAPVDGIVTNFDLQQGEYVTAGTTVFSLVGTENVWIQANYKETDLTFLKVGQRATVHIDMFPDGPRTAIVSSISPATGAEFALLPPQNATGNWVKVVQRLPVRLRLENAADAAELRAGMSVIVEVDTEHRRPLPKWARAIFGGQGASAEPGPKSASSQSATQPANKPTP
jgi:membrane fusion protein (multidrug efflux system)